MKRIITEKQKEKLQKAVDKRNYHERVSNRQCGVKLYLCDWCWKPVYYNSGIDAKYIKHDCCIDEWVEESAKKREKKIENVFKIGEKSLFVDFIKENKMVLHLFEEEMENKFCCDNCQKPIPLNIDVCEECINKIIKTK